MYSIICNTLTFYQKHVEFSVLLICIWAVRVTTGNAGKCGLNIYTVEIKIKEQIKEQQFRGHCLVLFEVMLTWVKTQFFKHISWVKYILKHSIQNLNENFEKEHWSKLENNLRYLPVISVNLAPGANFLNYLTALLSSFHWLCKMVRCSEVTPPTAGGPDEGKQQPKQEKLVFQICDF